MKKKIEMGTVFGDLIVIKHLGVINYNNQYLCKCSCGNERVLKLTQLLSIKVTNCGCKNFVSKTHANQKYTPEIAAFRAKASNYKALAKARKIPFNLNWGETIELLKGNCFYCGAPPNNSYNVRERNRNNSKNKTQYAVNNSEGYSIFYNGIDRVDNTIGYITGNVVSCCTHCNTAKLNYTLDELKVWVTNIYKKLIQNENENTSHI